MMSIRAFICREIAESATLFYINVILISSGYLFICMFEFDERFIQRRTLNIE